MARTGKPAVRRVAAVERALAVLDALAGAGPELGTNEIARRAGIHPSTVSRLLATLAAAGFVMHVEESGRYRLGVRLLQLGNAVLEGLDLRALARPHLQALAEETGETVTLSTPGRPDAVTVDFVQSPASVQSVAQIGRPSVAHATAAGKVALAFGAVELPPGRLEAFTSRTRTDRGRLAAELERVRQRGWAEADREREPDLSALAAPVRSAGETLTAVLGVQGPASRFDRARRREALRPLLERAERISSALGWSARSD